MHYRSFLFNCLVLMSVAYAGARLSVVQANTRILDDQMVLAKKTKNSAKTGTREKTIVREKVYRGDSRKVDFDAIDISGEKKSPYGSMVNQNKARKEYDLIKIRLRWHDEMKKSTSSLENGRSAN
jgi:hypothetical protein